ncbi:MAG: hypothetical protein FWC40_09750 [Proteobacteria bacterium]|nr:hypothetical protein [Pseudomonadota bacterium]
MRYGLDNATELPLHQNCAGTPTNPCPNYSNNLKHTRYMSGNSYIKYVQFYAQTFEVEPNYDKLYYGENGRPLSFLTGYLNMLAFGVTLSSSLQNEPIVFRFETDHSVALDGIDIIGADVCCNAVPVDGDTTMQPFFRHTGVLLGTNDVVYFEVPASLFKHEQFVLWPHASASNSNDFDIYIKCNEKPTPNLYDYRGFAGGSYEYVHIPDHTCWDQSRTKGGMWHVAVHSYRGAGMFNLVKQEHFVWQHFDIRAGTNFIATPTQMTQFASTLRQGVRHFYGATEGNIVIESIHLYNSGSCSNCGGLPCSVCFMNTPGAASSPLCGAGTIDMRQGSWNEPRHLSHELGHKYFCVRDEYSSAFGPLCGHSIMAAHDRIDQNNFCYSGNHNKDPGHLNLTTLPSAWQQARTAPGVITDYLPVETPDNYDYSTFNFSTVGTVGNVIRY